MQRKLFYFNYLFIFLFFCLNYAGSEQVTKSDSGRFSSIIYFSVGFTLGTGASEFFKEYNSNVGGVASSFKLTSNIAAGTKFDFIKGYRFGLEAGYFQTRMIDNFTQYLVPGNQQTVRKINEDITVNTYPVMLLAEAVPFQSQFRTYAGIGLGVVFSKISWQEDVSSAIQNDTRKGGLIYDKNEVLPSIRFYTGVELGFDKNRFGSFLGSLIIEVSYTYFNRKAEIFNKLSKQFTEVPESWSNKFSIIPDYVNLGASISFNFIHK